MKNETATDPARECTCICRGPHPARDDQCPIHSKKRKAKK